MLAAKPLATPKGLWSTPFISSPSTSSTSPSSSPPTTSSTPLSLQRTSTMCAVIVHTNGRATTSKLQQNVALCPRGEVEEMREVK